MLRRGKRVIVPALFRHASREARCCAVMENMSRRGLVEMFQAATGEVGETWRNQRIIQELPTLVEKSL
jgi:hypothetical protein